jgi:hypothetical protein
MKNLRIQGNKSGRITTVTEAEWANMANRGDARNFTVLPTLAIPTDVKAVMKEKAAPVEKSKVVLDEDLGAKE